MSEKQLTVAELLARSGKKPADSSRRRRRSVEEGGISIAELTGNIPKVEAKPASGKHNSDPIDNPATPKSVTGPKPAGVAEKEPKKQTPSQPASYATPAAAKPKVSAPASRVAAEPRKPTVASEPKKDGSTAPAKPEVKRAQPGSKVVTPATDETVILSVVDEKDPVRLTTGTFPAVSKAQADKAAKAEEKPLSSADQAAKAKADAEAKTATADNGEDQDTTTKKVEQTNVIPVIRDEDLKQDSKEAQDPELDAEEELSEEEYDEDVEYVDENGDVVEYVEVDDDEEWDDEDVEYVDEEEEWDEDETVSVPAIIGMAIAGILLGVLVFKGFEMLWGSLNKGIVTVLALGVTAIMVGVVHALRTNRDRLSMVLAVVVGLVMTFGPLLTIS